jgi:predicted ester cyclase
MDEYSAIMRFFDALNAHDPNKMREALGSDFVYEEVAGEGRSSAEALLSEFRMVFDAFPDIIFRPVRQTVEGDRTYVEFRAFGVQEREFLNVPPTRTMAIISGVFNVVEDQRVIHRLKMTVDFGGLRRQLLVAARRQ